MWEQNILDGLASIKMYILMGYDKDQVITEIDKFHRHIHDELGGDE
jgi:hypothetical protein